MAMPYVFDFETTGANIAVDRPVQIGMSCGLETPRIVMNTLVDPCMPIAKEATEVHGISAQDVFGFPDYLMGLWVMGQFLKNASETEQKGILLVGFNSSRFDTPMAEALLPGFFDKYFQVDVLDLIYRYHPMSPRKKLGEFHEDYLGEPLIGAHGAIQDCIGTSKILLKLCEEQQKSVEEFAAELQVPQIYPVMPIGKHKGTQVDKMDKGWARWMKSNAKDMRPDLQATVDYILGVGHAQAGT